MRYIFLLFLGFISFYSYSQTKGLIYKPSSTAFGRSILDPNGDGFVSLTTAGFSGTDYGANSELRMIPLPILQGEPHSDLTTGSNGGHTDIVSALVSGNPSRESSYILYKTVAGVPYVIIRMRIGKASTSPKGYSFLLNTDGNFNTGSSGTNPGYDKEIVLQTGNPAEVVVYSHTNTTTTRIAGYPAEAYSQRAVALSTINGDPDYFYDFFIPFSALGITNNPVGITAVTVTSAGSGIEGTISDFNGVDDRLYAGNRNAIMSALISTFPAIPITSLTEDFDYETSWNPATLPPSVNDGITATSSSISGTSVEADGTTIYIYKNGTQIGTSTVSSETWVLSGVSGLAAGDLITAKALASGKSLSGVSNTVIVSATQECFIATPAITSRSSNTIFGSWSGSITPNGSNVRIQLYTQVDANTITEFSHTAYYVQSNGTWSVPTGLGTSTFNGTNFIAKAITTTCTSGFSNVSTKTSGQVGTITPPPTVTTNPIYQSSSSQTITVTNNGASAVAAILILYVNDVEVSRTASTVAVNASNNFSVAGLQEGDVVSARAQSTSVDYWISNISNQVTVQLQTPQQTQAPTITGTYTAGAGKTITGTSLEASGTTITVYKNGTLIGTVTVSAYGTWQLTSQTLAASDVLTAYAKATGKSISTVSNSVTVQASAPSAPTVTGSYTVGNTSISGGSGQTLVRVYVDGSLVGTATPSSGNWTLSGLSSTELYRGAVIHATNVVSGIESVISNTATVAGVASFVITRVDGSSLGTVVSGDVLPIKIIAKDAISGGGSNFTGFTDVVTLSAELPVILGGGLTTNFTSGQLGNNSDKEISLGSSGTSKKVIVVNPNDPSAFGEATITVVEALWRGRSEAELSDPLLNKAHNQTNNWTHSRVPVRGARVKFANDVQQDMVLEEEYDWESVDMNNTSNHGKNIVLKGHNLTVQSITNRGNSVVKTTGAGKLKTNLSPGETFEFPIANSTNNFLAIKNNSGQSEEYAVRVFDQVLKDGYGGVLASGAKVGRTWDISKVTNNTSTSVDLTFNWNENQKIDYLDAQGNPITNHRLYHWTSQSGWVVEKAIPDFNENGVTTYENYTGTFSPFGIGDEIGSALPVEFMYFNTNCLEDGTICEWATASEHNSDYFSLLTSEDGNNWRELDKIKAAGNSTEKLIYQYSLKNNSSKYIKIGQFDMDGAFSEYGPFQIDCNSESNELVVYPNPANEIVYAHINNKERNSIAFLRLINLDGKLIYDEQVEFLKGNNSYSLNLNEELRGVFFIEFEEGNNIHRKKIIVL